MYLRLTPRDLHLASWEVKIPRLRLQRLETRHENEVN